MVELKSSKLILNKRYFGFSEMEMKNGMSKAATKLGFVADGATTSSKAHVSGPSKEDENNSSFNILGTGTLTKEELQELYMKIELLNDPAFKSKEEEFKAHQDKVVAEYYNKYGAYLTEEQTLELAKAVNAKAFQETRIRLSTVYQSDSRLGEDWKENYDFSRNSEGKVVSKTPNGKYTCTISSKWIYIPNSYTVSQCKDGTIFNLVRSQELRQAVGTIARFSSSIELSQDGHYRIRMNTPKD